MPWYMWVIGIVLGTAIGCWPLLLLLPPRR